MKTKQHTKPEKRTQGMNWIRKEKRLAIYLRDGLACCYCGSAVEDGVQLTLDHIKPYSKGGDNEPSNLVTCCLKCNSSRQDRPVAEFARAVAGYVKTDEKSIIGHISNCRKRRIDLDEAKNLMARRASWTELVENNYR